MKCTIAMIGVLLLLASIALAEAPNEIHRWSEGRLFAEGPLQSVREPVAEVCQFKIEKGKLLIDRQAWERAAKEYQANHPQQDNGVGNPQKPIGNDAKAQVMMKFNQFMVGNLSSPPPLISLFEKIQDRVGPAGKGWSGGGYGEDAEWSADFWGEHLNGRVLSTSAEAELVLNERETSARKLEFRTTKGHAIRLQLSNSDGDLVSLRQAESGRFTIIAILGDQIFADQAESFADLVQRHKQLMESEVFRALAKFGIKLNLATDSEKASTMAP